MLVLNQEQQKAYDYFIKMRDRCRVVITAQNYMNEHVPKSEVLASVDIINMNHNLFVENTDYKEYVAAFKAWLAVEPKFRDDQRMRASRGDYNGECDDYSFEPTDKEYRELI